VAQGSLHTIKVKKLNALILKMDLVKAYDKVSWSFLRLVLFQVGLSYDAVEWIMGCISFVNFVVLINGKATRFFKGFKGLRQGCPLSPLLFLLIIEGLSRMILNEKENGKVEGVKITCDVVVTHLLFVDDVIIFSRGLVEEWSIYKDLISVFCEAYGMGLVIASLCLFRMR